VLGITKKSGSYVLAITKSGNLAWDGVLLYSGTLRIGVINTAGEGGYLGGPDEILGR
jgi:hypothetical protein